MSRFVGLVSTILVLFVFAAFLYAQVNSPPIADAGDDQDVSVGELVQLDGSGSFDPDQDVLFYNWLQTGGPAVDLANSASAFPTFVADAAGTYTFRLTVSDGSFYSAPDESRVTAKEAGGDDDDDATEDDDTVVPYEPANNDESGCGF